MVKFLCTLRLRSAIRELSKAKRQRETLDAQDSDYGGIYLEQIVTEQRIKRHIAELKAKLARQGSSPALAVLDSDLLNLSDEVTERPVRHR